LKKINEICAKLYGLDDKNAGKWLDGSNTKVRNYLWSKLRYKDFAQSQPIYRLLLKLKDNKHVLEFVLRL